jgi:ABC-type amino acid transport substrate-binding protein
MRRRRDTSKNFIRHTLRGASGKAVRLRRKGLLAPARNPALKAFVDQWLHMAVEDGSFKKIYAAWFD